MLEGRVGLAGRAPPGTRCCRRPAPGLPGSTASAKRRLDSVYSWAQQTRVSPGRAAKRSSDASICAGVPSNSRPQPPLNSGVSPQKSSGAAPARTAGSEAMWPAVWPGTSITSKRHPSSSTASPPRTRSTRPGWSRWRGVRRGRLEPATRPVHRRDRHGGGYTRMPASSSRCARPQGTGRHRQDRRPAPAGRCRASRGSCRRKPESASGAKRREAPKRARLPGSCGARSMWRDRDERSSIGNPSPDQRGFDPSGLDRRGPASVSGLAGHQPGRYLLDWEQNQLDAAVADRFGFHALQLGLPLIDGLRANRMPQRWVGAGPVLPFRRAALPERQPGPRRCPRAGDGAGPPPPARGGPRAAARGALDHLGSTPPASGASASGWVAAFLPRSGEFLGYWRLRDWLRLLSYEIEARLAVLGSTGRHCAARSGWIFGAGPSPSAPAGGRCSGRVLPAGGQARGGHAAGGASSGARLTQTRHRGWR